MSDLLKPCPLCGKKLKFDITNENSIGYIEAGAICHNCGVYFCVGEYGPTATREFIMNDVCKTLNQRYVENNG